MGTKKHEKLLYCNDYLELTHQQPSARFDYSLKESLENKLQLGKYLPFATHRCPKDYMRKLGAYIYIYDQYNGQQILRDKIKKYLMLWAKCVHAHADMSGTYCYQGKFRALMDRSFNDMYSLISNLETYDSCDFRDFEKVLTYTYQWNKLQSQLVRTFYAHHTIFPKWLGIEHPNEPQRDTCAECKIFDNIGPPTPFFIALSAFFVPYESKMPDDTIIPEGVLVNEYAGAYHELHEHAHAYVHQKKVPGRKHLSCDWIEESIADWTAMQILQPRKKERSLFLEVYDFWIIINSIDEATRRKLIQYWVFEPEKVRWQELVRDMRVCLQQHRLASRVTLTWGKDERCNVDLNLQKYFI